MRRSPIHSASSSTTELANDTIGGVDVAIVYCSLCRAATAFRASVDGEARHFVTSGLLLDSNKLMVDLETSTVWHHLRGLALGGPEAGTTLDILPVEQVTWSSWVRDHPGTQVVDLPDPIFFDNPERPPIAYDYRPGEAYASYKADDRLWFPVAERRDDLEPKVPVIGIAHGGEAIALSQEQLPSSVPIEVTVGGASFTVASTGPGAVVTDDEGRTVPTVQLAWFAWVTLHPDTALWAGP